MNLEKNRCNKENESRLDMEKLELWISHHEKQMKKDIEALVAIPSVADSSEMLPGMPYGRECHAILRQMLTLGKREQMETENVDGYCLTISTGNGPVEIGIWNHLDVVPAGRGWIYPPYICTEKDGYLIGRGVQDNKGPSIAVLYTLKYCQEMEMLRNIKVKQILGCQEESGMTDVEYYLKHRKIPDYSFVADCGFPVCCGEKGHYKVRMETLGILKGISEFSGGTVSNSVPALAYTIIENNAGERIEETAEGISGHAAFPEGTQNAIGILCRKLKFQNLPEQTRCVLDFVERISEGGYADRAGFSCSDEYSGKLTCNVGVAAMHEGHLQLEIDIRYPVTKTPEDFLPKLIENSEKAGFKILETQNSSPYYMQSEHPFVQTLMEAWKEITGLEGKPFVMGGGTYARKIPNAVAFGPGQERNLDELGLPQGHGNCHCADETELLFNLKNAVKIYVAALCKLDKNVNLIKTVKQED